MTEPRHVDMPILERVPSGIPGLDWILRGGFLRAGIYIVQGEPGAGKTILGNQLCFNHVRDGGSALYVTLLAESHHRMLAHLRDLSFFDAQRVSRQINYIGAFRTLEQEGLTGLLALVRREITARQASVLVLDGLVQANEQANSSTELKKFIQGLQLQASATDCTMFLLTSGSAEAVRPEQTMVDGMIVLTDEYSGWLARRDLAVTKFRGGAFMRGRHAFKIDTGGIRVFPRVEAAYDLPSQSEAAPSRRLTTGIPSVDTVLGGAGLPMGSCTLVLGPTGSGKTTFGLHFLGQSSRDEPGLLFGFYESPAQLRRKAVGLVPGLAELMGSDHLTVHWQPATERLLDQVGHELLDIVAARKVRRLVVDGLGGFGRLAGDLDRLPAFFTALSNELRAREVTSIFTLEVADLVGPIVRAPQNDLTQVADNLILLRFAELDAQLRRLISVLKVRDSDFDPTVREFRIRPGGINVLEGVEGVQLALSGAGARNLPVEADAPTEARHDRGR